MPHDSASHDVVRDGEHPESPEVQERLSERRKNRALKNPRQLEGFSVLEGWLKSSRVSDEERQAVWFDMAGADAEGLMALLGLWLEPNRHFEPLYWMPPIAGESDGYYLDDFVTFTEFRDDGYLWMEIDWAWLHCCEPLNLSSTDPAVFGIAMKVVTRGLALIAADGPHPVYSRQHLLIRPAWERIVELFFSSLRRYRDRFDPDGYVYLLGAPDFYKIGRAKSVDNRVKQLGIQLPWAVEVVHYFPCEDYASAERELHKVYADRRANGEWFMLTPDDVAEIRGIARMRGSDIELEGDA